MSATVRSVCTGALRLLGVTQQNNPPSAADMDVAVYALSSMLESWSTQALNIYTTTTLEFDFIPDQATYKLGPSLDADWETERPMALSYCYLRYTQSSGTPIDMPIQIINDQQRAAIQAKTITSPIPTTVYYNASMPDATLTFWPVPSTTYQAILWMDAPLNSFDNLSDALQFPRGYEQAIRYNLAVNLAAEFGLSAKPEIVAVASRSINDLKSLNVTPRYLRCNDYVSSFGRRGRTSPIWNLNQGSF